MPGILRLLDANANRAREALRTCEDAARFMLDDEALAAEAKHLRHALALALAGLQGLELSRDTPGDVGTGIKAAGEFDRATPAEVVVAAGKRLSEALRCLEEYAKTLPGGPAAAARLEACRYRGYELERRLHVAFGGGRPRQWRLCVLLTRALCRHPWERVLDEALAAGADCIQVREKEAGAGELLAHATEVVKRVRAAGTGASAIINDRPEVALLCGADGAHLGPHDLPLPRARELVGRQLLLGVSTSSLEDARAAARDGADYCGVGPMYPTTTKDKAAVGPDYLRSYLAEPGLPPHLAIGGITPARAAELRALGARGLAVSSAVCGAEDVAETVRALL